MTPVLSPDPPLVSWALTVVNPDHRIKSKPWSQSGVFPTPHPPQTCLECMTYICEAPSLVPWHTWYILTGLWALPLWPCWSLAIQEVISFTSSNPNIKVSSPVGQLWLWAILVPPEFLGFLQLCCSPHQRREGNRLWGRFNREQFKLSKGNLGERRIWLSNDNWTGT